MAVCDGLVRLRWQQNYNFLGHVRLWSTAASVDVEGNAKAVKSLAEMPGDDTGLFRSLIQVVKEISSGAIRKPWPVLIRSQQEYGSIWRRSMGSHISVNITDPKHLELILRNEGKYPKRIQLTPWILHREDRKLSLGVLLQDGAEWHRHRGALKNRMLRPKEVASYSDAVNDVITDMINKVVRARDSHGNDDIVPDIENIMFNWSLDSACSVVLNKKLNLLDDKPHAEAKAFINAVHDMFSTTMPLFIVPARIHRKFRTGFWKKHQRAWDTIFATAKKLIDERMDYITKNLSDGKEIDPEDADFLTYTVIMGKLETKEIYANATELLVAAVDTTSSTLLWILYNLGKNPKAQQLLYEEVKRVNPLGAIPTPEQISQMPYMKAVVKESMRLYPPAISLPRILDKDITVGGYRIPANTLIMGNTWLMGRNSERFPNPLEYRPERWLRNPGEHFAGFNFLPFGYGPRMCIGKRLAELEIHSALARISQKFVVAATTDVEAKVLSILLPDRPLNLQFVDRTT